jgi:hypothetical protein
MVGVAYMTNATAQIDTKLTGDHAPAAETTGLLTEAPTKVGS